MQLLTLIIKLLHFYCQLWTTHIRYTLSSREVTGWSLFICDTLYLSAQTRVLYIITISIFKSKLSNISWSHGAHNHYIVKLYLITWQFMMFFISLLLSFHSGWNETKLMYKYYLYSYLKALVISCSSTIHIIIQCIESMWVIYISEIVQSLRGAEYFSKTSLKKSSFQVKCNFYSYPCGR